MLQDIAPRKFNIEYHDFPAAPDDTLLCFFGDSILAAKGENELRFPKMSDAPGCSAKFLFSIDDVRFFTAQCGAIPGFELIPVRSLRHRKPMHLAFAAAVGYRLNCWYETNCFCSKCAEPYEHSKTERALLCPKCGNIIYPTICPSVIIAVRNGDRLLLTRYQPSHSPYSHYALCAGYIETGESAEDAVRRELMEEVGLKVKNITYYKSQPWVFSGALLLGYFCDVDGGDTITRDENELSEALWVSRADMPVRSGDVSLTSEMMEQFRLGEY